MAGLRVLLEELYNDALNRKVFWHYSMPVDYSTDKVFQGLNFLILGLNEKTLLDPRWGTLQEYQEKGYSLTEEAEVVNVLLWKDSIIKQTAYAIPVFSVTQCEDDYSVYRRKSNDLGILEFLDQYRISYIESNNSSYSPLNNQLYINTTPTGEQSVAVHKAIPAISKWLVHNYDLTDIKKMEQQLIPQYLLILEDLVMFKMGYSLGIRIHKCQDNDSVCEAVVELYENRQYSILLELFNLADDIIKGFFLKKEKANDILLDFLTSEKSNELLRTLSHQEILEIEKNMEELKKRNSDGEEIAYLHFCSYYKDGCIDFYASDYKADEEEPVSGTLLINKERAHKTSYTPWDLCAQFEIDTLFRKESLKEILKTN